MKILKHPDTKWSRKHTCTNCTAELEIEKDDLRFTHYDGDYREQAYDSWYSHCPICSDPINISGKDIPKAVQVEVKIRLKSSDRVM